MIEVDYNEYKETIAENMKLIQEKHKLQERIDKAIEYIHNNYPVCAGKELLDILQGSDKE